MILAAGALGGCGPTSVTAGEALDGYDEAGRPVHLRVDAVEASADPEVWWYTLTELRSDGAAVPYCPADAEGKRDAVVVPGTWDARGTFRAEAGAVTFGCASGAVGKCVRLGYVPSRWPAHHLACVRMIRADVCGDGVARTVDGTPIDVWDEVGVVPRGGGAAPGERFEGAWSPESAVYVARPRAGDTSLDALVAACPERLRGRTALDGVLTPAQVRARYPEALVYDAIR